MRVCVFPLPKMDGDSFGGGLRVCFCGVTNFERTVCIAVRLATHTMTSACAEPDQERDHTPKTRKKDTLTYLDQHFPPSTSSNLRNQKTSPLSFET